MFNKIRKEFFQKGAAQLPIIIGLLLLGVALPAALKLVQESQETRRSATNQVCCCTDIQPDIESNSCFWAEEVCPMGSIQVHNQVCEGEPTVILLTNTPPSTSIPTNTPTVTPTLGGCNSTCDTDANCQSNLICYETTVYVPDEPGCTDDSQCVLCGRTCTLYSEGMKCPDVMPNDDFGGCVCENGECVAVDGGLVRGEKVVKICRDPDCPENNLCNCDVDIRPPYATPTDGTEPLVCQVEAEVNAAPIEGGTQVIVESSMSYGVNTEVEIRVTDINGNTTFYQDPETSGFYIWTWEIPVFYENISKIEFYVDVSGLGQGGEFCGSWDASLITPTVTNTPPSEPTATPTGEPTTIPTDTPPEGCKPCPDGTSIEARADYDCDGDVDMEDFAAWYDDYKLNSDNLYGDFNCNGELDAGDVNRWYIQLPKFD